MRRHCEDPCHPMRFFSLYYYMCFSKRFQVVVRLPGSIFHSSPLLLMLRFSVHKRLQELKFSLIIFYAADVVNASSFELRMKSLQMACISSLKFTGLHHLSENSEVEGNYRK
ncbi:uncharacterized protein LOC133284323 [Gastrolobium bilobum]|uniref:uncharacterized protein LOC133284323 n=1 Tax=Gastrolobium bilobum TaxID=150636 RepID=UPI002AB016E4|nr:uncharacterized protein LOC133284323 [Gastrolobium bilobum]